MVNSRIAKAVSSNPKNSLQGNPSATPEKDASRAKRRPENSDAKAAHKPKKKTPRNKMKTGGTNKNGSKIIFYRKFRSGSNPDVESSKNARDADQGKEREKPKTAKVRLKIAKQKNSNGSLRRDKPSDDEDSASLQCGLKKSKIEDRAQMCMELTKLKQKMQAKKEDSMKRMKASRFKEFRTNDVFYPMPIMTKKSLKTSQNSMNTGVEEVSAKPPTIEDYIPSCSVEANNTNNGKLFVGNPPAPFWLRFTTYKPKDYEQSFSLNAEVLLDYLAGGINFPEPPPDGAVQVLKKPFTFGELDHLYERDNHYFTDDVIYANSLRNMISLLGGPSNNKIPVHRGNVPIKVEEPTTINLYKQPTLELGTKPSQSGFEVKKYSFMTSGVKLRSLA